MRYLDTLFYQEIDWRANKELSEKGLARETALYSVVMPLIESSIEVSYWEQRRTKIPPKLNSIELATPNMQWSVLV